jgi:hypothetical protein
VGLPGGPRSDSGTDPFSRRSRILSTTVGPVRKEMPRIRCQHLRSLHAVFCTGAPRLLLRSTHAIDFYV